MRSLPYYLVHFALTTGTKGTANQPEYSEEDILRLYRNRNKQIEIGRKYIFDATFVNGKLVPPKYDREEYVDFDSGWELYL